jgi:hypothetical protein
MQDDPTTCRFIRSAEQYEIWAMKRRQELLNMEQSVEEDGDLSYQVNILRQRLDSLTSEVWDMKKDKCVPTLEEKRNWHIVVDFSVVVTLVVCLLIGIFCAIISK